VPNSVASQHKTLFSETLIPGISLFLCLFIMAPSITVVLWPVAPTLAIVTGLAATGLAAAIVIATAPRIRVIEESGQSTLSVGNARIPIEFIGNAFIVPEDQRSHAKGPGLDARSHRVFQVGVRDLVRLDLVDPTDPTPYWLIASRKPNELVKSLKRTA
jgi:hypothetical protein